MQQRAESKNRDFLRPPNIKKALNFPLVMLIEQANSLKFEQSCVALQQQ
jgi:hypothetical protein